MDNRPHVDAVSGQAAWMLVQILAMELVKTRVVSKQALREHIDAQLNQARMDKTLNPAQRAAAEALAQFGILLQTADRRDSN